MGEIAILLVIDTVQFTDRFDIGIVWVYGSGYATTLAKQTFSGIFRLKATENSSCIL